MTQDIRWKQRFQNFDRAMALLRDALHLGLDNLSPLEKEGMIQRFELKDRDRIRNPALSAHIARVGVVLFERPEAPGRQGR